MINEARSQRLGMIIMIVGLCIYLFVFLNHYHERKVSIERGRSSNITSIEQVYVVSLDRFSRYDAVKESLDKYDIQHIKFPATDGLKLKIIDENDNVILGSQLRDNTSKLKNHMSYHVICSEDTHLIYNNTSFNKHLTAGEFGCTCSHIRLWKDIVKNNYKYALILEDDIKLSENFKTDFENLLNNIPTECEVIYIHWFLFYPTRLNQSHHNALLGERIDSNKYVSRISKIYRDMWFSDSYILTLDGAKKFLDFMPDSTYLQIDSLMFQKFVKTGKVKGCKANLVPTELGMRHIIEQNKALGSVINFYGRK